MDQPPADAQYSPDGQYWWDPEDQQWKNATGAAQSSATAGATAAGATPHDPAVGDLSPDGFYRWDGTTWQAVENAGQTDASHGSGADAHGTPEGYVQMDHELADMFQNFDSHFAELAQIAAAGDGENYLAMNGVPAPPQDGDTALA
jgi:hypothetical protein